MARARSQSSLLRCLSLSYYVRRPRRLAILCILFLGSTFLIWDRQTLVHKHEGVVSKLNEENVKLTLKLNEFKSLNKGDKLPAHLDNKELHDFERTFETDDAQDTGEGDIGLHKGSENHAPMIGDHVVLDGLKDAPADPDPVIRERRDKVREAMIHAWGSYEKYAWGYDELKPMTQQGANNFGGLGATIIDSLDTLYIMGLHDQFKKATEWVETSLDFKKHYSASVFETTIRVLGGLLSSYDLSGNSLFITKAQELADILLPAWDTATGIPLNTIELASGNANNPHWTAGSSTLADLGTEQIEFIGLSQRTGIPKYKEKVEKVIHKLKEVFPSDGLLPIYISPHSGKPTTQKITFGAMGDSFYEYLLKVWIQGNKTHVVQHYREMWEQSMEGLISLIRKSNPSSYVYIAERSGDTIINKMDELACFAPGMLALGMDGASPEKASQYLDIAEGLAWTCYNFYMSTRTKLAGENYNFRDGEGSCANVKIEAWCICFIGNKNDMVVGTAYNILRPETVESFMYLWRKTGDNKYREWGWNIFQAFEVQSRVSTGYVGLHDVNSGVQDDTMQSFFLAETLKYLYLLFSPSSVLPLDEWVFNTEAHPIRILTRVDGTEDGEPQVKREESHLDSSERKAKTNHRKNPQERIVRKEGKGGTLGSFDYR